MTIEEVTSRLTASQKVIWAWLLGQGEEARHTLADVAKAVNMSPRDCGRDLRQLVSWGIVVRIRACGPRARHWSTSEGTYGVRS
jgi:DNA-binding transcriptional regulator GbsR (MarR family)